jgi:cardiolipin synthase
MRMRVPWGGRLRGGALLLPRRWRRLPVVRTIAWLLAGLLAAQAVTIGILSFVVAERRRHRKPLQGFPHGNYTEIDVGENRVKLYTYGQELYDAMLAAIEYAKESIYLESYLWKGDAIGEEFKRRLARKAAEGVDVYVIFDTLGNLVVPAEFKRFPPEIHTLRFQSIRHIWHLLDPRRYAVDHHKVLVVDGRIGFLGGYNIGSLYATEWRDTHLRVRGPFAADLAQSFVDFWNRFCEPRDRIRRHHARRFDSLMTLWGNDGLRLTFPIRDMYIEAIDRAESHILLTNAYFVPDHILLGALKQAAKRGVDVQVLVPWTSNHIVADWAARGYFTECLRAGIRIFCYRNAMIHAKTCTIDGQWSTIGTANLDRLSSLGNFEINVAIYSDALARQMEEMFALDKTNAFELTLDTWMARPWYVEVSELILAPLRLLL